MSLHDVEKTYIAKLYGVPDEGALQKFRRGVVIDGRKTKPAKIQILEREKDGRFCTAEIVIHEGRNRQVRKMCESGGTEARGFAEGKISLPDGEGNQILKEIIKRRDCFGSFPRRSFLLERR